MEHVQLNEDKGVLIASLNHPPANALNAAMVDELDQALDRATADDVCALVLTSAVPNFFSAGFDAAEVFDYDRTAMADFWQRFVNVLAALYRLPKPTVCGAPGHVYAGGALLALACDVRVLARGDYNIAISGVNIGAPLPPAIVAMTQQAVGTANARYLHVTGEPLSHTRAHELGIAQDIAAPDEVGERAVEWARRLAKKPPQAYARAKATVIASLGGDPFLGNTGIDAAFMDTWFGAESMAAREALRKRL